MILHSADCAGHKIEFIAFLCLNLVTIRTRLAGALSSWKIKLLVVNCRATTCQSSDSSMSMFLVHLCYHIRHIVSTQFQVTHPQIIRLTLAGGPGHKQSGNLSPHMHMVTFSYRNLTSISENYSMPSLSLFLCPWRRFFFLFFFFVIVANSYFLSFCDNYFH